jgi:hypothetical protein
MTDRQAEAPADREIVSTRVLDAPREVVYRAFTDSSVLARWWGLKGFTHTLHAFDPRPGGAWRFVAEANAQNFDRLERELVTMAQAPEKPGRHARPCIARPRNAGPPARYIPTCPHPRACAWLWAVEGASSLFRSHVTSSKENPNELH